MHADVKPWLARTKNEIKSMHDSESQKYQNNITKMVKIIWNDETKYTFDAQIFQKTC